MEDGHGSYSYQLTNSNAKLAGEAGVYFTLNSDSVEYTNGSDPIDYDVLQTRYLVQSVNLGPKKTVFILDQGITARKELFDKFTEEELKDNLEKLGYFVRFWAPGRIKQK